MITPQLTIDLSREVFIDNFAGGGGASTGIELALRRHVYAALNHDLDALAMHRMNHPQTKHYPEDIRTADPVKIAGGRPVGGVWFSPDCKHFSKAKGGKPRNKKIRGLAWSVIHWVNAVSPRVIYLENVEEFQTWCPLRRDGTPRDWRKGWFFQCFIGALRRRGYDVEWRELRACNYGAPTIRKRLFLIARRDGRPIVWPEATHAAPEQAKRPVKPYRTMAECIDFSLPCHSIFLNREDGRKVKCNRPLAKSTLARVAKGVERYVLKAKRPFIVELTHQGNDGTASIDAPVKTITAANRGEKSLVVPAVVGCGGRAGQSRPRGANEPHHTTTSKADACLSQAVLAPFVTEHANATHQRNFAADEPMRTICAEVKGGHFAAVVPYMVPRYGERPGQEPRTLPVNAPGPVVVPTANGGSLAAVHLTKFNTGSVGSAADEPGPTVTANSFIKRAGGAAPIGLVAASIVKMRGDPASHAPGHPVDEPGHTVSAQGTHHVLVEGKLHKIESLRVPTFEEWFAITKDHGGTREEYDKLYAPGSPERERIAAFIAQHNGGAKGHQTYGHPVEKPISTLSSKCSQQQVVGAALIPYYGSEKDAVGTTEPSRTVTTRDRFGLVEAFGVVPGLTAEQIAGARRVAAFLRQHGIEFEGEFATVGEYIIIDIGMRMLKPRELYLAQGFPTSYIIDRGLYEHAATGRLFEAPLTGTAQVKMCGNSVSPPMACALVSANNPEMREEQIAA